MVLSSVLKPFCKPFLNWGESTGGSLVPNVFVTASTTFCVVALSNLIFFLKLSFALVGFSATCSVTSSVVVSVTPLASVTSNLNSVSKILLEASIALAGKNLFI